MVGRWEAAPHREWALSERGGHRLAVGLGVGRRTGNWQRSEVGVKKSVAPPKEGPDGEPCRPQWDSGPQTRP